MREFRDYLSIKETVIVQVFRANDGPEGGWLPPEDVEVQDLVVTAGRTFLAQRIGANVNSPMAYMAVGSGSTAAALADTGLLSEQKRKLLAVNSALSNNVYTATATFGGAADTLTGVVLQEGGVLNHASSGQGTLFQRVTFSSVTLTDSDLLNLTLTTNVGSS